MVLCASNINKSHYVAVDKSRLGPCFGSEPGSLRSAVLGIQVTSQDCVSPLPAYRFIDASVTTRRRV